MSSQPENRFISSVHKYIPRDIHHEKMHNMYRGGTPDVYYSGHGGDMWIEYKYIPRVPQRGNVLANLSELQKLWLRGRYEEGRTVNVVIGCPTGGVILSRLEWERELPAHHYISKLLTKKEIADWITQILRGESHGNQIRQGNLPKDRALHASNDPTVDVQRPDGTQRRKAGSH